MQKGAFKKTRRADRERRGWEEDSRTGGGGAGWGGQTETEEEKAAELRLTENDKMTSHEGEGCQFQVVERGGGGGLFVFPTY